VLLAACGTGSSDDGAAAPGAGGSPETTRALDSGELDAGEPGATASEAPADSFASLELHAGYWIDEDGSVVEAYGGRTVLAHSVHHVDVPTRRMTVYAQARMRETVDGTGSEVVVSPPQLAPGTCGPDPLNGQTVCAHANAVYLDGSGEERMTSDGTGAWWVKHSWVLDGEGYRNCQLMPPPDRVLDYDTDCIPVVGQWQDDELTMVVGPTTPSGELAPVYNERRPLLDQDPVRYWINRVDTRPDAEPFTLEFTCVPDEPSPLDGTELDCPSSLVAEQR
jgi:hypothetical protein